MKYFNFPGFRPVQMMLDESVKVKFYDIGGSKKIRDIWDQYYHDVQKNIIIYYHRMIILIIAFIFYFQ